MENREYLNKLFEIYKDLLTKIEQTTFISYYIEDLSLSEIAENRGISKSSAGKTLKNVEDKLLNYEQTLKILAKKNQIIKILPEINNQTIETKITNILEQ